MRVIAVVLAAIAGISVSRGHAQETTTEDITSSTKLTELTYSDIRDAILLRRTMEKWEEISWRPNLAEAIEEAREEDKPILLWMMNGHPCGMT